MTQFYQHNNNHKVRQVKKRGHLPISPSGKNKSNFRDHSLILSFLPSNGSGCYKQNISNCVAELVCSNLQMQQCTHTILMVCANPLKLPKLKNKLSSGKFPVLGYLIYPVAYIIVCATEHLGLSDNVCFQIA